jgi:hypothetical protein
VDNPRDAVNGRFVKPEAGTRPAPAGPFDLVASLRELYEQASKAGEFTSAASIARVLAQQQANQPAEKPLRANARVPLDLWTPEELTDLRSIIAANKELHDRVTARHAANPLPYPVGIDPEAAMTIHRRLSGGQ